MINKKVEIHAKPKKLLGETFRCVLVVVRLMTEGQTDLKLPPNAPASLEVDDLGVLEFLARLEYEDPH